MSSAATHHRRTPLRTWSRTSAETLTQTRVGPGATPQNPTSAGSTATFRPALVPNDSYWGLFWVGGGLDRLEDGETDKTGMT